MPEPILLRSPTVRLRARLLVLALFALMAGLAWWWHREPVLALYLLYPAFMLVRTYRPPTEVSAAGIRRPWRMIPRLAWDEVSAVVTPRPGDSVVSVVRRNGRRLGLTGLGATHAPRVAEIGGKPMEPIRPATPDARTPTPMDADRDRELRLARLHRNQAELDATLAHIRVQPRRGATDDRSTTGGDPGQP